MDITLTKQQTYRLEPYGRFIIKWRTRQGYLPNIIPFDELCIKHDTTMPLTSEQDNEVIKFMKKNKTDILFNNDDGNFYTRAGTGFTQVWHEKLSKYRTDSAFKNAVDNEDKFANVILNGL